MNSSDNEIEVASSEQDAPDIPDEPVPDNAEKPITDSADNNADIEIIVPHGANKAAGGAKDTAEAAHKEGLDYVEPVKRKRRSHRSESTDTFDYVMPEMSFSEHMKASAKAHAHHRSDKEHSEHKSSTGTVRATPEEVAKAEEGFLFDDKPRRSHHHHHHHHSKKHRRPLWMKIVIIVLCVLIGSAAVLGATYLIMKEIGRRNMHNYDNIEIVSPTDEDTGDSYADVIDSGRTIVYDGVTYALNKDVVSLCVIGVDQTVESSTIHSMSDSINLAAFDTSTGKATVIAISRDTMTDIDLYTEKGSFIDTERMQMAYAYSFGNPIVSGGANTAAAVSRLFFGLPVENYFALNMDALITLNDAIGGVTLTSSMDFTSPIDGRYISTGDTVTLHGSEAERYVRSRDFYSIEGNSGRMERQREYIKAFLTQLIPKAKKDISLVSDLYSTVSVNSDSNLTLPKITYLSSQAIAALGSVSDVEFVSLKGELSKGEYTEMKVDDKTVLEMMLKVFYKPVEE